MATYTIGRDAETDTPLFGIIADRDKVSYLFPKDVEPVFSEAAHRFQMDFNPEPVADEEDLLSQAEVGLEAFDMDRPASDAGSVNDTTKFLQSYLDENYSAEDVAAPQADAQASLATQAYDQSVQDSPGFGDDDSFNDPEALTNYVLMALGPIDPEGSNGWILRAQDGNPRDGDENEYVHFPGTISTAPEAADSDSSEEDAESDTSSDGTAEETDE